MVHSAHFLEHVPCPAHTMRLHLSEVRCVMSAWLLVSSVVAVSSPLPLVGRASPGEARRSLSGYHFFH
jgi:hypothetical protein